MAETAGLVVGAAGLAALFDSCMSAFEYIDTGRQYGEDYEMAALKISILRLKLSRWGECVRMVDDASVVSPATLLQERLEVVSDRNAETVRDLVGHIGNLLKKAEKTSQRHGSIDRPVESAASSGDSMQALIQKTKQIALTRQKSSPLLLKARWALYDKKNLDKLINDLKFEVEELIDLFPTLKAQQKKLASTEAAELVQPSDVEEFEGSANQLEKISDDLDPILFDAIRTASKPWEGHSYNKTVARDNSTMMNGDVVLAHGMRAVGRQHMYNGVYSYGSATVQNGNQYGGKGIFERKGVFGD